MEQSTLAPDVRLMNVLTSLLLMLAGAAVIWHGGAWLLGRSGWNVRTLSVQGDVVHQTTVELRAHLAGSLRRLNGSFLSVDLDEVARLFQDQPWVRQARVQREFPDRLRVTLEEHRAVAWWDQAGSGQLVNHLGEIFEANPEDGQELPELAGPSEQAPQIWHMHQALASELARLDLVLVRLELNERGNWQALLDNGARLELGRGSQEDIALRVRRFAGTLAQVSQRYPGALQSVDLRYPNGYALRVQGVSTVEDEQPR